MVHDFFKRCQRLCYIERCSNLPHIRSYSVAQHSFYIALYAMVFADMENDLHERKIYDTSEVIKKALIHDLEESVTGDILYPLHDTNREFREKLDQVRIRSVDTQVFVELPKNLRSYYIRLWKTSKDESLEGMLVGCMDKFEILMFATSELSMGNKAFNSIYLNAIDIIKRKYSIQSVSEVVDEIRREFG